MPLDYCYDTYICDKEWEERPAIVEHYRRVPSIQVSTDGWTIYFDVKNLHKPFQGVTTSDISEVEFLGHAAKWERDTRYVSSMTDIVNHASYKEIIRLGKLQPRPMLTLLLRDLKENDRAWFTAMASIAGVNPVSQSDAGRFDRMTKAWLAWGKKEGLV